MNIMYLSYLVEHGCCYVLVNVMNTWCS